MTIFTIHDKQGPLVTCLSHAAMVQMVSKLAMRGVTGLSITTTIKRGEDMRNQDFLKLTPTESKILEDRLQLWDCLHDVASDDRTVEDWTEDEIQEVCEDLCCQLPYLPESVDWQSLEAFCLIDSVEGSTWIARMESYGEPQAKIDRHVEAMQSLGKKVAQVCGVKCVRMPWEVVPFTE